MLRRVLFVLQVDGVELDNIVAKLELPEELDFVKNQFLGACIFVVIPHAVCLHGKRLGLVEFIYDLGDRFVVVNSGLRA